MRVPQTRTGLKILAAAALLGLAGTSARAAILVQYPFGLIGQETTTETSPAFGPGTIASGVSATAVTDPMATVGLEISSAATTPTNAPFLRLDPQGNAADPNAALTNNKFFQFSITATSGADVDLSSLTFNVARGGAGVPRGFFVTTSADNFTTPVPVTGVPPFTPNVTNPIGNDVTTARPAYTAATAALTGAAFQNIQSKPGSTLTFRVYTYSPAAGSSIDFDDITVNGTSVVPEPASLGLLGCASLLALGRRRRRTA